MSQLTNDKGSGLAVLLLFILIIGGLLNTFLNTVDRTQYRRLYRDYEDAMELATRAASLQIELSDRNFADIALGYDAGSLENSQSFRINYSEAGKCFSEILRINATSDVDMNDYIHLAVINKLTDGYELCFTDRTDVTTVHYIVNSASVSKYSSLGYTYGVNNDTSKINQMQTIINSKTSSIAIDITSNTDLVRTFRSAPTVLAILEELPYKNSEGRTISFYTFEGATLTR